MVKKNPFFEIRPFVENNDKFRNFFKEFQEEKNTSSKIRLEERESILNNLFKCFLVKNNKNELNELKSNIKNKLILRKIKSYEYEFKRFSEKSFVKKGAAGFNEIKSHTTIKDLSKELSVSKDIINTILEGSVFRKMINGTPGFKISKKSIYFVSKKIEIHKIKNMEFYNFQGDVVLDNFKKEIDSIEVTFSTFSKIFGYNRGILSKLYKGETKYICSRGRTHNISKRMLYNIWKDLQKILEEESMNNDISAEDLSKTFRETILQNEFSVTLVSEVSKVSRGILSALGKGETCYKNYRGPGSINIPKKTAQKIQEGLMNLISIKEKISTSPLLSFKNNFSPTYSKDIKNIVKDIICNKTNWNWKNFENPGEIFKIISDSIYKSPREHIEELKDTSFVELFSNSLLFLSNRDKIRLILLYKDS